MIQHGMKYYPINEKIIMLKQRGSWSMKCSFRIKNVKNDFITTFGIYILFGKKDIV